MTQIPILDGPVVLPASGQPPKSMVMLLHGYGSNGRDLIGLVPYWRDALPDTVFLSPNAPHAMPGVPGAYQWWSLTPGDPNARVIGVRAATPFLDAYIDDRLAHYGLTEDRLALVGFSQGTMMALHAGPRRDRRLAGIIGFSGMLADPDAPDSELLSRPPVLLVHGDADPVIPVAALERAKTALQTQGFAVNAFVSRGLVHSIDPAGLDLGQQFLKTVLA